jgi:hypothetical protein
LRVLAVDRSELLRIAMYAGGNVLRCRGQRWYRRTAVYSNAETCWNLSVFHGSEPLHRRIAFAAILCLLQQLPYLRLFRQLFFQFQVSDAAFIGLSRHRDVVTLPFVILGIFFFRIVGTIIVLVIILQV